MDLSIGLMGLLVGFLVGLTGVGGAALLTPILVMMGINPMLAVGTDLIYNSITKLFGTIQHFRQRTIDLKLTKLLAIGSIPGAVVAVGALWLVEPFYQYQNAIVKHALGFVLIFVAIATLFRQVFASKIGNNRWQLQSHDEKKTLIITIGFILGFIVGLTSIGSGSLFALALLYFFRMRASELVGTDIAHAFILVTVAGALHASFGNVDYLLVGNLLIGSIPGVLLGSTLSAKVPSTPLRAVMATIILISGVKLVM